MYSKHFSSQCLFKNNTQNLYIRIPVHLITLVGRFVCCSELQILSTRSWRSI